MPVFGKGVGRVCAVVAGASAKEMSRQLRMGLKSTPTVELRLDWLKNDAERANFLRWLKEFGSAKATLLATCRRREGGGKFAGDIDGELYWLMQAREAGCEWCDLEMETYRELPEGTLREFPLPHRILLSIHDFECTPKLPRTVSVARHGVVDAVKIAAKAKTIEDSLRLLRVARRSRSFVGVPMGDVGLPARILALREGSELAYAPVEEATAPGQVSLDEMLHLYRAHELTRATKVYGVIGDPIGHSLSPVLHNTGFAVRRINAAYLPFLVNRLGDFLKAIPEFGICGFSVTLPHKQTILKHLKECEPLAAEIGAVNTVVVRRNGSLYGCNTDYVGVLKALQKKHPIKGSRALIFGAGGAARAAAFALARAGAFVGICARREKTARELARAVGGEVIARRALRTERFDAILNATPVGMHPHENISPLSADELQCRIVMDLIYRPERTKLLKIAAQKEIATVSGVEMFLAQGFAQWEIWTGKRAPEAAMRRAVHSALRWRS
ncbi:MAG TPA: shikimate dehydrogenase [Candidatus Acidoferrum sp.]|nr:shikimate dehydrogenase [Candidatus Acidoferrum sp.]